MSKWWSLLAAIGSSVLVAVTPTVHNWFVMNPVWATVVGGIGLVIAHWLPSPSPAINAAALANPGKTVAPVVAAIVGPSTPPGSHEIS
jgi:hypothetical protein